MIRAILFDLDGTLIDHRSAEREALVRLLHYAPDGRRLSIQDAERYWGQITNRYIRRYLRGKISFAEQRVLRVQALWSRMGLDLPVKTANELFQAYLKGYEGSWRLFPDALPCLNSFEGWKLGLVTNGNSEQQRLKLMETRIGDRFHTIVVSGDLGVAKPNPRIFRECLKGLDVKPAEALFIGDSFRSDWFGSRRAGLRSIWLARELPPGLAGLSPIPVISSLAELKGAIPRLIPGQKG